MTPGLDTAAIPRFPVDLAAPDIRDWRRGNTGILGVTSFDGPAPGPHVLLLRVAPVGGHEHEVRLDLRPGSYGNGGLLRGDGRGPAQVFRLTASDDCALS